MRRTPPSPPPPPRPNFGKHCPGYPGQAAAQADYDKYYPWYGDVFGLDRDKGGIACESN